VSSSKAEGLVHYTTLSASSNHEFGHVDPAWICSGNSGPLPQYVCHSSSNATAAGQHGTTNVEDQPQADHNQRHNSHNSHSLPHTTPDGQPGSRDVPPPQSRTADGAYRCSECLLVFQKRHLLKYVNPPYCKDELTLTQYLVDTSGFISLPTSAQILGATSDSVRSETSIATSSRSTPQTCHKRMSYFVITRDASMQKGEAKYARGGTIWPDTSVLSTRKTRRFLMPYVVCRVTTVQL
jgi:hypothetical protein